MKKITVLMCLLFKLVSNFEYCETVSGPQSTLECNLLSNQTNVCCFVLGTELGIKSTVCKSMDVLFQNKSFSLVTTKGVLSSIICGLKTNSSERIEKINILFLILLFFTSKFLIIKH